MNDEKLLRYKKPLRYISLDGESENLNPVFNRPWQLAWIVVEDGKIISKNDHHIDIKDLKVGDGAARVTHFDLRYHNSVAKSAQEVYDKLCIDLFDEKNIVLGHNFYFDFNLIKNLESYLGIKKWWNINQRVRDKMVLSKAYKLNINPPEDPKEYVNWQFNLINHKQKGLKSSLGLMLNEFKIDHNPETLHNAIEDVTMTHHLFQKLIWAVKVY